MACTAVLVAHDGRVGISRIFVRGFQGYHLVLWAQLVQPKIQLLNLAHDGLQIFKVVHGGARPKGLLRRGFFFRNERI